MSVAPKSLEFSEHPPDIPSRLRSRPNRSRRRLPLRPACRTQTNAASRKSAGMYELKKLLEDEVVSALRDPEDLKAYGLTIPNGILLFGPPGCGKRLYLPAIGREMNFFFKEVFPSEIGSTFIHETTLKIREVFDHAYQHAPAIIFVDEFESMVPARRNLGAHQQHTAEEVSEFLKQLEASAERKILLIAATNEPWKIDPAVQRTGRLDKKIYVGPPDQKRARGNVAVPPLRAPPDGSHRRGGAGGISDRLLGKRSEAAG